MPDRSGKLTQAEINRAHQEALAAFYRMRSESLRNSHTTTTDAPGVLSGQHPNQQPAQPPRKPRPGILGCVADAFENATGWH